MKRLAIIAAAVAVLAMAAVAVGGAATSAQEGDGPIGTFLAKVADKLGVSEDELQTAIDEARTETLDEAVAEGRLTEEQAERLQDSRFPFPGRPRHGPRHGPRHVMDAAAEVLSIDRDELVEQLRDGNSLAEVAEAQGTSVEEFETALLAEVQSQLNELVAEGDLTQGKADEIFQRTEENIDRIVNATPKPHGPGGFDGPRPGAFGDKPQPPEPEAESSGLTL